MVLNKRNELFCNYQTLFQNCKLKFGFKPCFLQNHCCQLMNSMHKQYLIYKCEMGRDHNIRINCTQ